MTVTFVDTNEEVELSRDEVADLLTSKRDWYTSSWETMTALSEESAYRHDVGNALKIADLDLDSLTCMGEFK